MPHRTSKHAKLFDRMAGRCLPEQKQQHGTQQESQALLDAALPGKEGVARRQEGLAGAVQMVS